MRRSKMMLALLATVAVSACAGPKYYQGPMSAAYEVPAKPVPAVGTVVGVFYPSTMALTWTVQYKDLTGPPTAAHVHGPAPVGVNAPVVIPAVVSASPITGGATLTPAQAADLMAGKYYFNIHTAANPGGEMRGQMLPAN